MKRISLALLALSLLAPAINAQSVTLPKEIQAIKGEWIVVAPEAIDGGVPRWRFDPGLSEVRLDLLFPSEVKTLKGKVLRANKDGRYKVEAWNGKGDVASDIAVCWIVVGEPGPLPGPTPGPGPEPSPTPTSQKLRIVVIEETADATGQRAVFFKNAALKNRIAEKGHAVRMLDKDVVDETGQQPAWAKAYIDRAAGRLPFIILTTVDGKLVAEQPLGDMSPETVIKLLAKWGG